MARRGRPSKKTLKKRKAAKKKSQRLLLFAFLILVALGIAGYFFITKQGI